VTSLPEFEAAHTPIEYVAVFTGALGLRAPLVQQGLDTRDLEEGHDLVG
jgi:hypothetical protein